MSSVNIGVLISGGGTNLQSIIDGINCGDIRGQIKLVISNKKEAYGLKRAQNAGIEAIYIDRKKFATEELYNKKLIEELEGRNIDLIVLAGYLKVLSKNFVGRYKNRIINIHPSLIPSFCGKGFYGEKVHRMALDYGVKITGATVHFVDEGTDTGPIILQKSVEVKDDDTVDSLKERVLDIEHQLLPEAVKLFCEDRLTIKNRRVIIHNP